MFLLHVILIRPQNVHFLTILCHTSRFKVDLHTDCNMYCLVFSFSFLLSADTFFSLTGFIDCFQLWLFIFFLSIYRSQGDSLPSASLCSLAFPLLLPATSTASLFVPFQGHRSFLTLIIFQKHISIHVFDFDVATDFEKFSYFCILVMATALGCLWFVMQLHYSPAIVWLLARAIFYKGCDWFMHSTEMTCEMETTWPSCCFSVCAAE